MFLDVNRPKTGRKESRIFTIPIMHCRIFPRGMKHIPDNANRVMAERREAALTNGQRTRAIWRKPGILGPLNYLRLYEISFNFIQLCF
jgi:hypothetical protein